MPRGRVSVQASVRCSDGRGVVGHRHSRDERRTMTTASTKAGGSVRVVPIPNKPSTSPRVAEQRYPGKP